MDATVFLFLMASTLTGTFGGLAAQEKPGVRARTLWAAVGKWVAAGERLARRVDRQLLAAETAVLGAYRRWTYHRFTCVDENAKCPGCGHRQGRIEFSPLHRLVIHVCFKCGARWGEPPVVAADHWVADPHSAIFSDTE
jgi:hypothetical protein